MEIDAYIGLGSNLGDKRANCLKAVQMIERLKDTEVRAVSPFYKTEPVGVDQDQDWYLNGVAQLATKLSPVRLMKELLTIERQLGRERKKRWDSRTIDLDILFYGNMVINEESLEIPHPRLHLRRFVLVPLADLAPGMFHPVLKKTVKELLEGCPSKGQEVVRLKDG